MTQQELFLKLANPDENGFSRWVYTSEFCGEFSSLELLNGLSWGRKSSNLAKKYILITDKTITKSNKIDRIKLNGFNNNEESKHTQYIRKDIREVISKLPCVILGTHIRCDHKVEVDHKDGRKNNPRVMNTSTQTLDDFQPLSKPANDAKRQICKKCKETNLRFDAKKLGYNISFIYGDIHYNEDLKCRGCFWYDPLEFRKKLF